MAQANNIGYLLQHLSFVLARHSDQVLQEQLGIGFSQFKILMVLGWHPGVQQKWIAEKLGQTEASISRQIKLLQKEGFVTSVARPENRREHVTRTTPKGERLTDKALEILNKYHSPMFAKLTDKQRERMVEALNIMHNHACQADGRTSCHPLICHPLMD